MGNRLLANQLIKLRERDVEARERLVRSGALSNGYDEGMEKIHVENASTLIKIMDKHGWPGLALVGPEAAEAAWLIAQHAISCPSLQRRFYEALSRAVEAEEAPAYQLAYLTDRIRFNERRQQIYGTIHDWDEANELSPWPIEQPSTVDALRQAVGLPALSETTAQLRARAAAEGEMATSSYADRQAQLAEWARQVGWI